MRYWLPFCCFAGLLSAQGTTPKPKPEDYEVHAQAKDAAVGAEFMVHSFSSGEQTFLAKDYLVVEVALYPPKGATLSIRNGDFSLRLNRKEAGLQPASPSDVVFSLNRSEWSQPATMIPGGPRSPDPVPGGQPPVGEPRYNPASSGNRPGKSDELLLETALVEGPHHAAFSGFLYFPYRGKMSSIKTLELLFEDAVLKLR